ncbi:PstS family phosphate ABC transporter substrate-binding protein [Butyrivibrio sp. INlla14]|uniref:PstS family phosphate ABC transporter substrate-binding protein n=1 Tax=Butyrivibrio sp. INlla14 TaxID=1520808 RepID=UPI0008773830|nr:substrate-binding domain-containing protein [Butyrivibrio sp. INlla14]SCY75353.1 phosphate transport system substrate-binding protein [Butyrivibrio sp. INlla14]
MKKKILILATALFFLLFNGFLYVTLTMRLGNNYSGTSQLKMVDVGKFLPFEEDSELARTGSSLYFTSEDDLPVLDGAAALVPVYASVIDNIYPEGCVTYEGGVFSDDNYYGENFADDSVMQYQNTIRGFDALVDGSVDLFFTAHPSKEQLESAAEKGVELEIVPVGLEAFVFFVNSKNPVDDLSVEKIRGIYRGQINNWKEVGGPNRTIDPILRIKGSGSQTMMEKFMEGDMITKRDPLDVFGASIGYSFRYYLSGMIANDNVKMLSVNGVYPNAENIKNGSYPISANFYVVYRKDNDNHNVKRLVDWLLTDEGQAMIEGCGYVGLK